MSGEELAAQVSRLTPAERALLDLSLRREVPDSKIGQLMAIPEEEVVERRQRLLAHLAPGESDGASDDAPGFAKVRSGLLGLGDDVWLGEGQGAATGPRRTRLAAAAALGLLVLAFVAWAIARSDSAGDKPVADNPPGQPHQPAASGPAVAFVSLPGPHPAGTVTIRRAGPDAVITLRGVPPPPNGAYTLWLFNTPRESRRLGSLRPGTTRLRVRLPRAAARYGSIDLSLESSTTSSEHRGRSLFRIGMAQVPG